MEGPQFRQLTIAEQERFLSQARALKLKRKSISAAPILPVDRDGPLPLSFAQQRLWFLAQTHAGSKAYHMPYGMCLLGKLDRQALRRALDRVVVRHESLRTTFIVVEGEPRQRIASAEQSPFHLLEQDLRQQEEVQSELKRLMVEEAEAEFDLVAGPLVRGRTKLDQSIHTGIAVRRRTAL